MADGFVTKGSAPQDGQLVWQPLNRDDESYPPVEVRNVRVVRYIGLPQWHPASLVCAGLAVGVVLGLIAGCVLSGGGIEVQFRDPSQTAPPAPKSAP